MIKHNTNATYFPSLVHHKYVISCFKVIFEKYYVRFYCLDELIFHFQSSFLLELAECIVGNCLTHRFSHYPLATFQSVYDELTCLNWNSCESNPFPVTLDAGHSTVSHS